MKKTILFVIAVVAFVLMGCDRNSQPVKENASDAAASLEGCDMAVFEDGKVTFYNSSTNTFVPFADEKDYVLSGVFFDENEFCYTVSVDDELYLKKIDLSADKPAPVELADWELKLSDCYDENSEKCASMVYYPEVQSAFFGQFFTHSMHRIHSVPFLRFLELSVTSTFIGHTRLHFPQDIHFSLSHFIRIIEK